MSDIQTKEYPERENKMGTMPVPKLLITMSPVSYTHLFPPLSEAGSSAMIFLIRRCTDE